MPSVRRVLPLRLRRWLEMRMVRLLTYVAARAPRAWRWRGLPSLMRGTFDPMAHIWERTIADHGVDWSAPLVSGLAQLPRAPERALDLGTGTGLGAALVARRFPGVDVMGVDISPAMVEKARDLNRDLPNVRFVVADSYSLPFQDACFDLVTGLNVPLFFSELARITRPGGSVLICFTFGERTPIYLPTSEVERKLVQNGFGVVRSGRAGQGIWTLGVKDARR